MDTGFSIMPHQIARDGTISMAAKVVYLLLTSHSDYYTGACFPSHALLAEETRLSVSTVQRALKELAARGMVRWVTRYDERGGQTSNVYYVNVHAGEQNTIPASDPPGHSDRPPQSEGPTPPVTVTDEEEPLKKNQGSSGVSVSTGSAREADHPRTLLTAIDWIEENCPDLDAAALTDRYLGHCEERELKPSASRLISWARDDQAKIVKEPTRSTQLNDNPYREGDQEIVRIPLGNGEERVITMGEWRAEGRAERAAQRASTS